MQREPAVFRDSADILPEAQDAGDKNFRGVKVKTWRKLVWSRSRAFIALRLTDLNFSGLEVGKKYLYTVIPGKMKIVVKFRRRKK
jgi:hypothetical protein